MRRLVVGIGAVLAIAWQGTQEAAPVQEAVDAVRADRIREYVAYLASDELEGRMAGYPGNEQAAAYIADHFRTIGLEPVGDEENGERTYFQRFDLHAQGLHTQNVVGLLPGRDEALRDQIVVVGAHMDHVGTADQQPDVGRQGPARGQDPNDRIWNGADDNASGSSTVMEAARAMATSHWRPRRSILFILFSAEEWGLLGSQHYVRHPLFPKEAHAGMINLDMVGRNPEQAMDVGGTSTAQGWEELARAAAEGLDLRVETSAGVSPGSDHYSFASEGIPAVHLFTNFHAQYHRPADHADLLAIDRMGEIAKFTVRLAAEVADRDERLEFVQGSVRAMGMGGGRTLGIRGSSPPDAELDEAGLPAEQGGIRVDSVEEESPAGSAGIQEGDLILSVNGEALSRRAPMTELRRLIRRAPAGEDVAIVVMRGTERVTLTARFVE